MLDMVMQGTGMPREMSTVDSFDLSLFPNPVDMATTSSGIPTTTASSGKNYKKYNILSIASMGNIKGM